MERTKREFRQHFVLGVLVLAMCSGMAASQASDDSDSDTEPIQNALKPVYKMSQGFVDLVQQNDLSEVEHIVDKWVGKMDAGKSIINVVRSSVCVCVCVCV